MGEEIQRYGTLARLPDPIWIGFTGKTKGPPGSDVNATYEGVTQTFHDYFSGLRARTTK